MKTSTIATWVIVAAAIAALWFTNRAEAVVQYEKVGDRTYQVKCANNSPDETSAECLANLQKICPHGGSLQILDVSEPEETPVWVVLLVQCNERPDI